MPQRSLSSDDDEGLQANNSQKQQSDATRDEDRKDRNKKKFLRPFRRALKNFGVKLGKHKRSRSSFGEERRMHDIKEESVSRGAGGSAPLPTTTIAELSAVKVKEKGNRDLNDLYEDGFAHAENAKMKENEGDVSHPPYTTFRLLGKFSCLWNAVCLFSLRLCPSTALPN